jgi:hypothetical protein
VRLGTDTLVRVRGQYPLPTPQGGRAADNLILTADQKEATQRQARPRRQRAAENAFDADAVAWSVANGSGSAGLPARVKVGYGRRNPNEVKQHGGRKKGT